jgi:hypothetical protein
VNAAESDAGFAPMNIEAGQTSGDSRGVSRPFQMERTWINDLHRQRKLYQEVARAQPRVCREVAEHHRQKGRPPDADKYRDEKGKLDKYFSPKPGDSD